MVSVITWDLVRVATWSSYVQEVVLWNQGIPTDSLRQYPLVGKMLISLGTLLTYQFLLLPSESNQRPYDVLPTSNVIGPTRNAKMIDRCHTSNKSDERTLEYEDTDTLRGETLGKWHSAWLASCFLVHVKKDHIWILDVHSSSLKWLCQNLKRDFEKLRNVPIY